MSSSAARTGGRRASRRANQGRRPRGRGPEPGRARRALRPWGLEALEGRDLLATLGVDYQISGFRWDDPDRITYSIAPDGVFWDHGTNALNGGFDAKFGDGRWEREVARALATWQAAADINIVPVGDSAQDMDARGREQGDPRFGDIRFGGHVFPGDLTTLGATYPPPPSGGTSAGDVTLNLGLDYRIGADFDLYSVVLHETGHSLGLDHPPDPSEVMDGRYGGVRSGLSEGDLAGIRAIYGPRQPDAYRASGRGASTAAPIDATAALDADGRGTLTGLSLSTIGDTTYFSVTAPAGAAGTFRASAVATGISLLSPRVSILDASGRVLDADADPAAWSNTVTAEVGGVAPGDRFLVAVTGATSDVFAVGDYALRVAFDGVTTPPGPAPTPAPAPTPRPIPAPPAAGLLVAPDRFEAIETVTLGTIAQANVADLTLHGAGDVDRFAFTAGTTGVYNVAAPGTVVRVIDGAGRLVTQGVGGASIRVNRPQVPILVEIVGAGGPVADYEFSVSSVPGGPTIASGGSSPWSRWTSWRAFGARRWSVAPRAQLTVESTNWARAWSAGRPGA